MNASSSPARLLSLPRAALTVLSHRCASLGPDGVRALREAGYRAGLEVLPTIDEVPERLPARAFWERLDARLTESGFGSIEFEPRTASVGAIAWRGSPEAGGTRAQRAVVRCHFAAGLLGGILSRVAGKTVDVLEVRCGSGESGSCRFLFGSVASLHDAQGRERSERAELIGGVVTAGRGRDSGGNRPGDRP